MLEGLANIRLHRYQVRILLPVNVWKVPQKFVSDRESKDSLWDVFRSVIRFESQESFLN